MPQPVTIRPIALVAAGLVAAGAGLAACGGEESPEGKDAFIVKADAICERLGKNSEELADQAFSNPGVKLSRRRLESFDRQSAGLARTALAQLRGLRPPAGDEGEVDRIWDALADAIDEIEALGPNDPGEPGGPAEVALGEFGALASAYGFGTCAEGI